MIFYILFKIFKKKISNILGALIIDLYLFYWN